MLKCKKKKSGCAVKSINPRSSNLNNSTYKTKQMIYFWQSVKTRSYWKYALLSSDGIKTFFAVLGAVWLLFEILDFFRVIDSNNLPTYSIFIFLLLSIVIVLCSRRPVSKIRYKVAGRDLQIEVRIGDLFSTTGQKVISTNTTFDTDVASGIIAASSLQGQFSTKYYPQQVQTLDHLLEQELADLPWSEYKKKRGKERKYPMGTTVRIKVGPETCYLLAMSDLNYDNTAQTTFENVLISTNELWNYIAHKGENEPIVLPLIGTGRGRITVNRKRLIATIAQSFTKASEQKIFSKKLVIVIHPSDAENFEINL